MIKDYKNPRRVNCYGKLIVQGLTYWLLHLEPVTGDSWESDSCMRFLAVPNEIMQCTPIEIESVFDYPRHVIVNGDFILEILEDHTILVPSEKEREEETTVEEVKDLINKKFELIDEPLLF